MQPVLVQVLLGTLGSVSILVNGVLLIIFYIEPLLCKEFSNVFVCQLSIANLIVGMNDVLQAIIYDVYSMEEQQSQKNLIKISLAVLVGSYFASLLHITAVTISRLLAILFPLKDKVMLRFSRLRTVALLNWGISLTIFGLTIPIGLFTQYLPLFYGSAVAGTLFVSIVVIVAAYAIQLKVVLRHIRSIRSTLPKFSLDEPYTTSPLSTKLNQESKLSSNPRFSDLPSCERSLAAKGELLRTSSQPGIGCLSEDGGAGAMMSDINNSHYQEYVDETIPEAGNCPCAIEFPDEKNIVQHRRRKMSKPQEDVACSQGSTNIELSVFCIGESRGGSDAVKDEVINIEKIAVCAIESHGCRSSAEYEADVNRKTIVDKRLFGDSVGEEHKISNLKESMFICDRQIPSCLNIADADGTDSKLSSFGAVRGIEEFYGKRIEQCVTSRAGLRDFRDRKAVGDEFYECTIQKCCRKGFEETSVLNERQRPVLTLKLDDGEIINASCLRSEPDRLTRSKKAELPGISVRRKLIESKQELRALIYCISISLAVILTWFLTALGALGLLINSPVLSSPDLSDVADIIVAFGASFNSVIFVITNRKMRWSIARRFRRRLQRFR